MTKLTVIIVSYNVRDLLRNCLHSIFASASLSADWLTVEIIVVDNASQDGSAEMVAAEFPSVRLIASSQNLGFTGGNNLALATLGFSGENRPQTAGGRRQTTDDRYPISNIQSPISALRSPIPSPQSPDFVLLLNPDAELVEDALGKMVAFLRDHAGAGACGARLCYGDGRFQHGAFRFPTLMQIALDLLPLGEIPGLRRFLPQLLDSRWNGRYPQSLWRGTAPFRVDFVLGAALMVRGEAVRQIGLLDDSYFMYCEEMDWCLRLRQAGWTIHALPAARVVHHEGQSSRQRRWISLERLWRSRFRFYHKYPERYPPYYLVAVGMLVQTGLSIRGWLARRRFAHGEIDGAALAQELSAYQRILKQG
ncbi:MAG: glycosyltransferase [Caldilineaceae bacterium]|nr:glycosyltransferase [Caldilineaceae bacterium]